MSIWRDEQEEETRMEKKWEREGGNVVFSLTL